jgi:AraC-like DNA-binding protein
LNEICKTATGNTVKQYIDNYLILESKRWLCVSDLSVKELTYQLGFDEPTNFQKFLKSTLHRRLSSFGNHCHMAAPDRAPSAIGLRRTLTAASI